MTYSDFLTLLWVFLPTLGIALICGAPFIIIAAHWAGVRARIEQENLERKWKP